MTGDSVTRIHAICTGSVRIRTSQRERRTGGLVRVLLDNSWTEWLPIFVWVIEHAEGVFVVDAGETARTQAPGYFPRWHPYYRRAVQMDVSPNQEVGPQLKTLGISKTDIRMVVLTHFHTDHVGGLDHFTGCRILASAPAYRAARGLSGRLQGYLPQHLPRDFMPEDMLFTPDPIGPFDEHCALTRDGDLFVVPTPGHTPHHVSVVARSHDVNYFLAGDTSYTQDLLLAGVPDGVAPRARSAVSTLTRIRDFAEGEPTVYLPTHDPESEQRLLRRETVYQTV